MHNVEIVYRCKSTTFRISRVLLRGAMRPIAPQFQKYAPNI